MAVWLTYCMITVAISEIFSVKEWPDLEIWVWDSSRSLKMAPFDRLCTTFCWWAIVTIALSCTIFELFGVEFVTLKSGLEVTKGHWNWCHSNALSAFHSNYGSILHHLRGIATYLSKIANFLYPTCICGPAGVIPSVFSEYVWYSWN